MKDAADLISVSRHWLARLLEKIRYLDDEGPYDSGWQSSELAALLRDLEALIETPDSPNTND